MGKDFYIQPDAADPVLDPDAVLAIVRLHAAGAKAVRAVDESGGEARTYAIDDGLILKVQRPQQLRANEPGQGAFPVGAAGRPGGRTRSTSPWWGRRRTRDRVHLDDAHARRADALGKVRR